ncbi:hypothetical protein ACFXTH_008500 [Malus domestica]
MILDKSQKGRGTNKKTGRRKTVQPNRGYRKKRQTKAAAKEALSRPSREVVAKENGHQGGWRGVNPVANAQPPLASLAAASAALLASRRIQVHLDPPSQQRPPPPQKR